METVIIMGAAGRDFHNFNVYFRDNARYKVAAFTATQIPAIDNRVYPPELAGAMYPRGVPIHPEEELPDLIRKHRADLVVFSYSDVPHMEVMHKASQAMALGADFLLVGAQYTMLESKLPVVSVCAVRTGCGKSQTTREICSMLRQQGKRVVAVRHPMPYGDLSAQAVQRFSRPQDFDAYQCTIEEREEYEPLVDMGIVVYAGIDYGRILERAEEEAEVIVWDGGNNDTPFYRPDVQVVLFDPHRPGHELTYYPGETNMRMADIAVINKVDSAPEENIAQVRANIETYAPGADIVLAESEITMEDPDAIRGKRVLVVGDGPTLTHGGMPFGAGVLAAEKFGAAEIVDPRPRAVGTMAEIYEKYPHLGNVLPAMGYHPAQVRDLEQTINAVDCDVVVSATPFDLAGLVRVEKTLARVRYEYKDHSRPTLRELVAERLARVGKP